jgi:hypothetical protein
MNTAALKYTKIAASASGFDGSSSTIQEDIVAMIAAKQKKSAAGDANDGKNKKARPVTPGDAKKIPPFFGTSSHLPILMLWYTKWVIPRNSIERPGTSVTAPLIAIALSGTLILTLHAVRAKNGWKMGVAQAPLLLILPMKMNLPLVHQLPLLCQAELIQAAGVAFQPART